MIRIVQNFTGYPIGPARHFAVGEEPKDLPADYQALLVAKGHAVELPGASADPAPPARVTPPKKQRIS